jgi:thymidylate synthase (FAD)
MFAAWDAYHRLLDGGVKPEIARYVLPNACITEIICTWNFREIRHIIKMRTSPAALPEFRIVAEKIKIIMIEQSPKVFGDL